MYLADARSIDAIPQSPDTRVGRQLLLPKGAFLTLMTLLYDGKFSSFPHPETR